MQKEWHTATKHFNYNLATHILAPANKNKQCCNKGAFERQIKKTFVGKNQLLFC
jgi:hypothetical protein